MTVRPAIAPPTPISLDALLTRASGGPARQPSAPIPRHRPPAEGRSSQRQALPGRSLDELYSFDNGAIVHQFGATSARYTPLSPPTALVLLTTVATCECGLVHRLPNASVFLRYGNDKSIHFRRASLPEIPEGLPRLRQEHNLTVPYCEGCF